MGAIATAAREILMNNRLDRVERRLLTPRNIIQGAYTIHQGERTQQKKSVRFASFVDHFPGARLTWGDLRRSCVASATAADRSSLERLSMAFVNICSASFRTCV